MFNNKVKCKINGLEVEALEGSSVIQAFRESGQDIAHYCWHPGLSVAGVCRLCMVEIKGQDKLQIACNTQIKEGMEIFNQSDKVKEAVRWGLEFHLINHPLDCPICDQAGECALQDQYMKFGRYTPGMGEYKVKKRKVVDLGSKIVLDTERCILCSRCVRFTDEVTKTGELGIFNRGDRSEIGVFKDKPLENDYAVNTVDICPVGALTSKDFRFKQRVWYLKTADSICTGCSTGCHTFTDYNEEGLWRTRPRYNPKINGYWMCDKGRGLYQNSNRENRLNRARKGEGGNWRSLDSLQALSEIKDILKDPALILTGQYTNEEYEAFRETFGSKNVWHWVNNEKSFKDFDGLLLRGDRNPNTAGLKTVFPQIKPWSDFEEQMKKKEKPFVSILVAGPENPEFFPDIKEKTFVFEPCAQVVWMARGFNPFLTPKENRWQIPVKTFFEKEGAYTNFQNEKAQIKKQALVSREALSLEEIAKVLKGEDIDLKAERPYFKQNQFLDNTGKLW